MVGSHHNCTRPHAITCANSCIFRLHAVESFPQTFLNYAPTFVTLYTLVPASLVLKGNEAERKSLSSNLTQMLEEVQNLNLVCDWVICQNMSNRFGESQQRGSHVGKFLGAHGPRDFPKRAEVSQTGMTCFNYN